MDWRLLLLLTWRSSSTTRPSSDCRLSGRVADSSASLDFVAPVFRWSMIFTRFRRPADDRLFLAAPDVAPGASAGGDASSLTLPAVKSAARTDCQSPPDQRVGQEEHINTRTQAEKKNSGSTAKRGRPGNGTTCLSPSVSVSCIRRREDNMQLILSVIRCTWSGRLISCS